jgi:hypothetical protein
LIAVSLPAGGDGISPNGAPRFLKKCSLEVLGQPSKRAKVSSASSTIHITTARQTKPTMLRKCTTSGSRPAVG